MSKLILVNSGGSFTASPVTAVNVSGGGTPLTVSAPATFVIVNAGGTYTLPKTAPTNIAGSVGAVAQLVSATDSSGSLLVIGTVEAVASVTNTAGNIKQFAGLVSAIGSPNGQPVSKAGQETRHNGLVGAVVSVAAADARLGTPTIMSVTGEVSAVALSEAIYSGIVVVVVALSGQVPSVASVSSVVDAENVVRAMCYVTMTLLKVDGMPVGKPTKTLVNKPSIGGASPYLQLSDSWIGVPVTAKLSLIDNIGDLVITTDVVRTTTDSTGFAQFKVFQGYSITISCTSLGSAVTIDTTGLDTIDLSTFF